MKKEEIFKDIKFYDKKCVITPEHTFGWKFGYKGDKYGNYISDQKPTGKFRDVEYWDDEERKYCEDKQEIYKTVPITAKAQIALMKNMIEAMERLDKEIIFKIEK